MGVLSPPNMIVTLTNVIFFIVMQTLFFKFIASKQFNVVLKDKVDIANRYLAHDDQARKAVQEFLKKPEVKAFSELAKKQEKERKKANLNLMKKWIGIPLAAATVLLLIFIFRLRKMPAGTWEKTDTALLSLVVGAYTTEVLFYFGIVRQYHFYGDHRIYSNLYDGVRNNIPMMTDAQIEAKLNDIPGVEQARKVTEMLPELEKAKDRMEARRAQLRNLVKNRI